MIIIIIWIEVDVKEFTKPQLCIRNSAKYNKTITVSYIASLLFLTEFKAFWRWNN